MFSDWSGWLATVMLLINAAVPYWKRKRESLLKFHIWIGYALPAIAMAHGWASMVSRRAVGASVTGINLATVSSLLLFLQLALGVSMSRSVRRTRETIRRLHFANMLVLAALVAGHLALNRK